MATKATRKMSLKLLINKKDDKVVFAEAKKDFIDFLFNHFLTLPIGTIVSFLPKENCLRDLHESINKMEKAYLLHNESEDLTLKLKTPVFAFLPFFNRYSSRSRSDQLTYMVVDDYSVSSRSQSDQHDDLVTYMVADDLSVTPMSMTSTMALFKKYNIQEVDVLEEKVVSIGLEEVNNSLPCWVLIDFFSALVSCKFCWSYLFPKTQLISKCYLQIIKPCLVIDFENSFLYYRINRKTHFRLMTFLNNVL